MEMEYIKSLWGLFIRMKVQGSGFKVQGSGFRVQGSGFRVQGCSGGFAASIYEAMLESDI